ncbi:MAG TPA: formate dehydrogenase accessory sulfurtransferase FdhD [Steroidobacteraceae bacterium]|nr:formate dehydrogenase accessory sulfurtransferase FdhD [Steroidobacteraceae bacterium]
MPAQLPGIAALAVRRWRDGHWEEARDEVAEEAPVALTFNSIPHVVMLATPRDLTDLGRGFALTEALVAAPAEIRAAELKQDGEALEVALSVPQERLAVLLAQRRNLTGRTGCGVCGAETIAEAIRRPAPVASGGAIARAQLAQALRELRGWQTLGASTGSLHAAAWVDWQGGIRLVREDVGRHNALDKVVGALLEQGADLQQGFLIITSRASYEMVQKAATAGIRLLVAVSAPTALAVRLAQQANLTLVGFARDTQQVVYTHPERVT